MEVAENIFSSSYYYLVSLVCPSSDNQKYPVPTNVSSTISILTDDEESVFESNTKLSSWDKVLLHDKNLL